MAAALRKRVLAVLETQDDFVTTLTVANALKVKRGKVNPALHALVRDGQIEKKTKPNGSNPQWRIKQASEST